MIQTAPLYIYVYVATYSDDGRRTMDVSISNINTKSTNTPTTLHQAACSLSRLGHPFPSIRFIQRQTAPSHAKQNRSVPWILTSYQPLKVNHILYTLKVLLNPQKRHVYILYYTFVLCTPHCSGFDSKHSTWHQWNGMERRDID
jgi:hypothetical protein